MSSSLYTGQQRERGGGRGGGGDGEDEDEDEENEENQIDMDVALVIIQSELQEFYNDENINISNKALAQRKRVLENVLKSFGKNVTSPSCASCPSEEEEEEKYLLLQNLISLLQVPKVKDTEELLLAANGAILTVLKQVNAVPHATRKTGIDPSFLGFAFSSLLELASGGKKNTNCQKVRQSSLRVVFELVRCAKHKVSTLAFFLPGIVSALIKLLHSSRNEWIDDLAVEQCLYCLSEIICCVLSRDASRREDWIQSEVTNYPSSNVDTTTPFAIKYSKEWFEDTVSKVTSVLNSTIPIFANHANPTVRKACAAFSATVLEHCKETLPESQRILLETLLSLSHDSWELVSMFAKGEIVHLKEKKLIPLEMVKVILKADLGVDSSTSESCPSSFHQKKEMRALATINLLGGDETSLLLLSSTSTRRGLIHALAQGGSSKILLRKIGAVSNPKFFELLMSDVMTSISSFQDGAIATYIFVANEILRGAAASQNVSSKKVALSLIIDEYVSRLDSLSSNDSRELQRQKELLLEGLTIAADILGPNHIENTTFFTKVLRVLLEYSGHVTDKGSEKTTSEVARRALESVAATANYDSAAELISENCDFVIDLLVRQLRHLDEYPRAPQLFGTVLRLSSKNKNAIDALIEEPLSVSLQQTLRLTKRSRKLFSQHAVVLLNCFKQILFVCKSDNASIARDILLYSSALLESFEFKVRSLAAEIIAKALSNISSIKEENVLPSVHNLWPHLVQSFRLHYHNTVHLNLMKAVVRVSQGGKFIRKRFYEDLWPIIVSRGIATEFVNEFIDYPECFAEECVAEILAMKCSISLPHSNVGLFVLDEDMFWLQQTFREPSWFSPARNDLLLRSYDDLYFTTKRVKQQARLA